MKTYPYYAIGCSIIVQAVLWHHWLWMSHIKDYKPSLIWTLGGLVLVATALLVLDPVIQRGMTWQKIIAALLCLPLIALFIF